MSAALSAIAAPAGAGSSAALGDVKNCSLGGDVLGGGQGMATLGVAEKLRPRGEGLIGLVGALLFSNRLFGPAKGGNATEGAAVLTPSCSRNLVRGDLVAICGISASEKAD